MNFHPSPVKNDEKVDEPEVDDFETKSPGTKLLKRRREMYTKQKEYDDKKKSAERAEKEFKDQEDKLRNEDIKIQDTMIRFSILLQKNMKKQETCTVRIKDEESKIKQFDALRDQKVEELTMLQKKDKRVKLRMQAIKIYDEYLNKVKDKNLEEFPEITDILSRHRTLMQEKKKLTKEVD